MDENASLVCFLIYLFITTAVFSLNLKNENIDAKSNAFDIHFISHRFCIHEIVFAIIYLLLFVNLNMDMYINGYFVNLLRIVGS